MPRTLFKISLIYLLYLGINFFFQDTILTLLSKSLPFSETYYPSLTSLLFVYAFPILLGFYIGNSTDRTKLKNYIYFINLSLIAGLLYYIPFIFSTNFFTSHWFNALVVSYILLLFPFFFCH